MAAHNKIPNNTYNRDDLIDCILIKVRDYEEKHTHLLWQLEMRILLPLRHSGFYFPILNLFYPIPIRICFFVFTSHENMHIVTFMQLWLTRYFYIQFLIRKLHYKACNIIGFGSYIGLRSVN